MSHTKQLIGINLKWHLNYLVVYSFLVMKKMNKMIYFGPNLIQGSIRWYFEALVNFSRLKWVYTIYLSLILSKYIWREKWPCGSDAHATNIGTLKGWIMATKSDIVFRYCLPQLYFNVLRSRIYLELNVPIEQHSVMVV